MKPKSWPSQTLRIVIWLSLVCGPGHATIAERLTLEDMVERSERIVQGRCIRTWSAWDAERQFIWTHSEIEVLDSLKGAKTTTLLVSEPGGVVDGVGMTVEGAPRYERGEELVLFAYRVPNGFWRARGFGQGKFTIVADPRSGERRVNSEAHHTVALVEAARIEGRRGTDLRQLNGMPLEQFKARVRGLASARRNDTPQK